MKVKSLRVVRGTSEWGGGKKEKEEEKAGGQGVISPPRAGFIDHYGS